MNFISILEAINTIYGIHYVLGAIAFIILVVFSIFIISILTQTPFNFSIGFFKIAFGSKYNSINKVGLITSLMEYQEDHVRKIIKFESLTLKRQLSYSEQKLSQIKYILTSNYLAMISDKISDNEDAKLHKDYKSYQIMTGMLIREIIDKVLHQSFLENHFDEMNESAWNRFLLDKAQYILNFKQDFLDNMYGEGRIVTREESYEKEKLMFPEMREIFYSIYNQAKEISIQSKIELNKERENANEHIRTICRNNGFSIEDN